MTYEDLLHQIIERGLTAAREDYQDKPGNLQGAVEGFESCRGKPPHELTILWLRYGALADEARGDAVDQYWRHRCAQLEVEWVMNVVSVGLTNEGHPPLLSWQPTARAVLLYSDIVGVEKGSHGST